MNSELGYSPNLGNSSYPAIHQFPNHQDHLQLLHPFSHDHLPITHNKPSKCRNISTPHRIRPKYTANSLLLFCDYCDVYLTHDSMSVRKAHNSGRNHLRNVVDYYQRTRVLSILSNTI
ncbi:zf-U1-domain-containing protein [Microthyrium microscopicum]|uniref:Zf-U1-domain-containing protein n=1 Tax=Microthyrium microscopicum TaxID=703497 RepID=A0A6A6UP81_9PEZI|nr:zf-U1-domain-containing protein [Microthyrium microscopicum]